MFKNLSHFTIQLFKETVLQLFFLLDVIGIVLLYWKSVEIPIWILTIIPVLGIYLASFKIYKRGTADIRITFSDGTAVAFRKSSREGFVAIISGNIANYGVHTGILEDFGIEIISINNIHDSFVQNKIGVAVSISPLLPPKTFPTWFPGSSIHEGIKLPLVLETGRVVPVCLNLYLHFSLSLSEMLETIEWLKSVNINAIYSVTQSDGKKQNSTTLTIPTNQLKVILENDTDN